MRNPRWFRLAPLPLLALLPVGCSIDRSAPDMYNFTNVSPAYGPNTSAPDGGAPPAPDLAPAASAARGQYLVEHVALCGDCHTPRDQTGAPIAAQRLAGIDCFVDIDPTNPAVGCIASRNLTNHSTGLQNRSDQEIKDLFTLGKRPDGTALFPLMPYYTYHVFDPIDVDSIVLYLRTVPGVDHAVAANQPPWDQRAAQPAPPLAENERPTPLAVNAATTHGRYLASIACLECHTRRTNPLDFRALDTTKLFAGGNDFPAALLGLPSPPFPAVISSINLTTHATTGLTYTKQQLITLLRTGKDKDGRGVCPPMPTGPGAFGGMTDADLSDLLDYILALPPIENAVTNMCTLPGT